MIDNTTFTDRLLSKELKEHMVEELTILHEAIDTQWDMSGTLSDIPNKDRDGFWAWTDGGVCLEVYLDTSYLIHSGKYPTWLTSYVDYAESYCNDMADSDIGKRTEENEEDWYDSFDEYMDNMGVWLDVSLQYYSAEGYGDGINKVYIHAELKDEYGKHVACIDDSLLETIKEINYIDDADGLNHITALVQHITSKLEV